VDEGKGRCGGRIGEDRGRDSDMEKDECDPLDNSPMLAGLLIRNVYSGTCVINLL